MRRCAVCGHRMWAHRRVADRRDCSYIWNSNRWPAWGRRCGCQILANGQVLMSGAYVRRVDPARPWVRKPLAMTGPSGQEALGNLGVLPFG